MRVKTVAPLAGASLFSAPLEAQTPEAASASGSVKEVIAKGVMVNFGCMEMDFIYSADGAFTGRAVNSSEITARTARRRATRLN